MTARDQVESYIARVTSGELMTGRLCSLAVRRHVLDLEYGQRRGLRFDEQTAEEWCRFFRDCCVHTTGEFNGQAFELRDFQAFVVWCLFGWKRADGTRRFRDAMISFARGNGKSPLAAAMGLGVVYEVTDCDIRSVAAWDLHRLDLDPSSELAIDPAICSGRVRAGLTEGQYVVYTAAAEGLVGLALRIDDALDEGLRQLCSWSTNDESGYYTAEVGWHCIWATVLGSYYRPRCRSRRLAGETYRHATAYLYCWADALAEGQHFHWSVTTAAATYTSGECAWTTPAWDSIGGIHVAGDANDCRPASTRRTSSLRRPTIRLCTT